MNGRRPSAGTVAEGANVLGLLGCPGADRQLRVGRAHTHLDDFACLTDYEWQKTQVSGDHALRGRPTKGARTEVESHLDADLSPARLDHDVNRAGPAGRDAKLSLEFERRPLREVDPGLVRLR